MGDRLLSAKKLVCKDND